MPELPEVETSKRYIEQFLLNAKILNIHSSVSKLRWEIHPDIKFFFNNTIFLKIDRIGKNILTNSDGKIIIADLSEGKVLNIEKVSGDIVSEPFIFNNNLYVVRSGSIVQYN